MDHTARDCSFIRRRKQVGKGLWRGAGGRFFFRIRSIAASKSNNNNGLYFSATMATSAIFGLLRPSTRIPRGHAPPYGQTPPGPHPAAHRLAPHAAPHRLAPNGRGSTAAKQHALPLMLAHLDKAHWGASPPPSRLAIANATPLRRPPHPLQVHRGSSAPLLFMQAGIAKRLKSWHKRARARRSCACFRCRKAPGVAHPACLLPT